MGNPIEDGMSQWHDKFRVPASHSDKQYYKNLGEKNDFPDYSKREDLSNYWAENGYYDPKPSELFRNGTGKEYFEYTNAKALEEASTWRGYRKEYINLVDLTSEHTNMGEWNWKDEWRFHMKSATMGVVSKRRRYKIKNPHWVPSEN